jgi:hypothetical protein
MNLNLFFGQIENRRRVDPPPLECIWRQPDSALISSMDAARSAWHEAQRAEGPRMRNPEDP